MSRDGKSKEPSTALESTWGCSNRCNCTTLDGDSGAGANAGSRVDMTFVGAGPLSELVWSPQKGLSLKCADGSFCQEKPCILWCPEASNRATDNACLNSATHNISEGDRTEIPINFLNSSTGVVHPSISSHEREPATCDQLENLETMAGQSSSPEKEGLLCDHEHDMRRSRVGNNCGSVKQIIAAGEDDEQNLTKKRDEDDFPAKLEAGSSTKKVHEVAHSSAEVKIISPQGNELVTKGEMPLGTDTPSSSRIRRYRMKGKGRALSDGIPDGMISHEGDNSHESVESCNSAVVYSAGKKQLHYDPSLIVGSKRLKRHIQDSPGSSSLVRHDSSFMNWISNMMNGLVSSKESTVPSVALTLVDPDQRIKVPKQRLIGLDKKTGSAGFQTFFDSLYRPKRKAHEILPLNSADRAERYGAVELDAETGSFYKLFKLPDSKSNECALQNGIGQLSRAIDSSKNLSGAHHDNRITASMRNKGSINLATEKGEGGLGKKINFELSFDGKANQAYCSEGDPVTSLWIARFTPTVPAPLSEQDACSQTPGEAPTCPANGMTLKNIVPSDATQDAVPAPIHPAELGASSVSPSKSKCKEGNGYGRRLSDGGDCHFQAANALSTCDGNETRKWKDLNTRQDDAVSSQHEKPKLFDEGISSCSMRRKSSDDPKLIFDAVKRLQLSRSDVLKWIHSHMPLSCLDGYFVRPRLVKSDAGLGKPQYHVACITGVHKERVLQNPKFSISVDVGGISCIVESRSISNQDFVEDELMAWWTSNSKGGGGKVPSEEELRLKFQEKKMLGL